MDSLPKDLDYGLLQELECPVCMECMKPPITMCENGHSICPNCKPKLDTCPSCTKPFLNVRNLALENLSRQVTDQDGPQQPVRLSESFECPFTKISKDTCPWRGPLMGMKDHVKVYHNNVNDMRETNGVFTVVLTGVSPAQHYRKAVLISDELFYIYWQIKDDSFSCAVLYVGHEGRCSKYKYKFTLATENGDRKISMSFPTRHVLENFEEVLNSGDSVILKYNTILKFLNTNMYLECEFQINAIELDMDVAGGTDEGNLCAKFDVQNSPIRARYRWNLRHENSNYGSSYKQVSVGKPGRCLHGRRFRHCRRCKHFAALSSEQGIVTQVCTDSAQNVQPQVEFYCEPRGCFVEDASQEKIYSDSKVAPSAPTEKVLHSDAVGNLSSDLSTVKEECYGKWEYSDTKLSADTKYCSLPDERISSNPSSGSTWKCKLCEQVVPKFPGPFPEPGWNTSVSPAGTKGKCKICGQIRQ
jgi:hypothetical protein